jgi:hypothetical protein
LERRIRIRIKSEKLDPVPHSVQIQNVKSCVEEPKMFFSAPAPAPDSFVRYLENYIFFDLGKTKEPEFVISAPAPGRQFNLILP